MKASYISQWGIWETDNGVSVGAPCGNQGPQNAFVKWPDLCPLDCYSSSWRPCPSSCTCPAQQRRTPAPGLSSGEAALWDTSPRQRSISHLSPAVTSCLRSNQSDMGWPGASPQPVSSGSLGAWFMCRRWAGIGIKPAPGLCPQAGHQQALSRSNRSSSMR